MRLTRVYVPEPLTAGRRHTIAGDAAGHIARVLRLKPGDPLTLFDGRGGQHAARIEALRASSVIVQVQDRSDAERESPLPLTLAQGISRGERMDWVVQKATELGVARIVPVLTDRSVVRLDPKQSERKRLHWQGIVIAACEQSGRNRIPEVSAPRELRELLGDGPAAMTRALLSPGARLRIGDLERPAGGMIVLIGPEGGLSESEQRAALSAGFVAVGLGPRILRTETAAIAALTLLQHRFGDI